MNDFQKKIAWPIGLWFALMLAASVLIAKTHFQADLSAFLPTSPNAQQRILTEQLQSGLAARTLLIGIEGGTAPQRAEASRALARALQSSDFFEQVHNGEPTDWAATGEWLFTHRYALSPSVTPERFTPEGLRAAIQETLSLLGTPAGSAIEPILYSDPTGETARIAESLLPAQSPRREGGVWVSRTHARAVLLAITHAPGADLDAQAATAAFVRQVFSGLAAAPELTLQLSGTPIFSIDSRDQIVREVRFLSLSGGLLISALLCLAFASLRALLVALLPVLSGLIGGIAAVSLSFGSVHGLTLAFGSTLIGESVDYAIYYLIQARTSRSGWLQTGWPTVRLGVLTSVCGFAALVFSGFPGLAQLGVFSMAGLAAAALTTRFVLPVLMPQGASTNQGSAGAGRAARVARVRYRFIQGSGQLLQGLPRWRGLWLALGVAALGLLAWQRGPLWGGSLAALSPVPPRASTLNASLRADLGASDARTMVLVQAPTQEAALQATEAAAQQLDTLVERGVLQGFDAASRVLPSQATQAQRLASLPAASALEAALAQATRQEGSALKASQLAAFVEAVADARAAKNTLLTRETLARTALAPWVDALLFARPTGDWVSLMPLQNTADLSAQAVDTIRQSLQGIEGAQVIDIKHELDALYARYLTQALTQSALGVTAILAVIGLWLRSGRRLLAVCQPLALAVLLTLGGLTLFKVELGILHWVGLLLVVAVGSNYALFFDVDQKADKSAHTFDEDTLASLLLANLTTVISFGLIAISDIPALSAIGRVVAPGALLALLLAASFRCRR